MLAIKSFPEICVFASPEIYVLDFPTTQFEWWFTITTQIDI